jgi:hypothetical protein
MLLADNVRRWNLFVLCFFLNDFLLSSYRIQFIWVLRWIEDQRTARWLYLLVVVWGLLRVWVDFTWLTRNRFILWSVVEILSNIMLVLNCCIATKWRHILNISVGRSRNLNSVCFCLTSSNYSKSRFVVKFSASMRILFLYGDLVLLDFFTTLFHTLLVLVSDRNWTLPFWLLVHSFHFFSWFMQIQHRNRLIVQRRRSSRC